MSNATELEQFSAWLVTRGISLTSQLSTVQAVASLLRQGMDPADNDRVERLLEGYAKSTRAGYRNGWRQWQRFRGVAEDRVARGRGRRPATITLDVDPVEGFTAWLVQNSAIALITQMHYGQAVRGLLRTGTTEPELLEAFRTASDASRQTLNAAWPLYRAWRVAAGHALPPPIVPREYVRDIPAPYAFAVHTLRHNVGVAAPEIAQIQWSDLSHNKGKIFVRYLPDGRKTPTTYYREQYPAALYWMLMWAWRWAAVESGMHQRDDMTGPAGHEHVFRLPPLGQLLWPRAMVQIAEVGRAITEPVETQWQIATSGPTPSTVTLSPAGSIQPAMPVLVPAPSPGPMPPLTASAIAMPIVSNGAQPPRVLDGGLASLLHPAPDMSAGLTLRHINPAELADEEEE